MVRLHVMIFMVLLPAALLLAYPGSVKKEFTAPGRFCTGMTFDGEHLWIADYKADKLFKINPLNGETVASIPSPGFWPTGLAWDGQNLWNVDRKQSKMFKIDPKTGNILNTLDAPSSNPQGLTWDGNTLWVSDNKNNEIMKIDMNDGTAVQTIRGPARRVQGITFDGTYLWAADRYEDELYMIDAQRGQVIMIVDSPGPYPRGMAWDGQDLWNVDYEQDKVRQLVRKDDDLYRLSETRRAAITLTHEVKTYGQGNLHTLQTFLAVPRNMPQQTIKAIDYAPQPSTMVKDRWKQNIARFDYENKPSEAVLPSIMTVEAEISDIRYYIYPDRCGEISDIPEDTVRLYTADGSKYHVHDPYIQNLARQIIGDETNPYWMARKIFDFLGDQLEYELEGGWNVAPVVLKRGTGSCSEYTISFIALARAAGIPARYMGAIVVRGDDASLDDVFHRWPEIYLPNYGWIPIDPQGGDKESPRAQAMNIGNLSNRFLITTRGGGDSEYLGWYYNYNETYTCDPQVKVNIETFAEWEPLDQKDP
ncbi:MAG: transglutaminase [Caldithrix sp.]|nr:transglutaminase [Caldithrix sp.]